MPLLEQVGRPLGDAGSILFGNQSWTPDEYNVDLATPQAAVQTYQKMRKSDGTVRSCINRLFYTLLSAEWRIDPAEPNNPEEEKIAEFVESVLMPGESSGFAGYSTWYHTLRHALLMTVHGYSVFEKVLAYRPSDGMQVYASLEPRLATTIMHFDVTDDGGPSRLQSITQWTMRKGLVDMPVIRNGHPMMVVLSFNREGDYWWGESILRAAHPHWRYKRAIMGFDAIHCERMGGFPWLEVREGMKPTPEQVVEAKLAAQNFRVHQNQAFYVPSTFKLNFAFPQGGHGKCRESIELHNQEIEASMLSEWQSLGTGSKGARSVGEVQLDFMLYAYQGIVKQICDDFNAQYVVPLVNLNFGEREKYPKLEGENFLQMKTDRLAEVMAPLVASGLVRVDKPLRDVFRKKFSFPEEDEATLEPVPQQGGGAFGKTPPATNVMPTGAEGMGQDPGAPTKKLAKRSYGDGSTYMRRQPKAHETGVDWQAMQQHLDHSPPQLWYREVLPIRQRQIAALAKSAGAASEAQLAQGQLPKPELEVMSSALYRGLMDSYKKGRSAVRGEWLGSQAQKADTAAVYPADPTAKQSTWIKRLAQALGLALTVPLWQEAVRAGQQAQDQGADAAGVDDAVRKALEALSQPKAMSQVAAKVSQAYTTGRVEQGQAMSPEVESIFYSALMDDATCAACEAMDGAELGEDWADQVPNPNCDGAVAGNCRCAPVFVWREQSQQQAA